MPYKNPEDKKTNDRLRYSRNRDFLLGQMKTWRGKNQGARKEYARAYYLRNQEKLKLATRVWYRANHGHCLSYAKKKRDELAAQKREFLLAAKNRPCADCRESLPSVCMDFDHPPGTKEFSIGANTCNPGISLERFKREIAKCEVVCANCHRIRTHL